ncbi:MAG: DUF3300 domain-containing protein [Pseudomonadota bacterium]
MHLRNICRQGVSLLTALGTLTSAAFAQIPVDDQGQSYAYDGAAIEDLDSSGMPARSGAELDELVGPVALYPDALLAVVLPAAAYPLQIVQAARFLEALEDDPTLTPPADWDESVIALLNYPEVLAQLNEDIDWTLALGEAVIAQQPEVLSAVQRFRDRVYAAGHLQSDTRQEIVRNDDIIEIRPVDERVLYVPVYEPETVVYRTSRPVYRYYSDPYPVYYYPYSDGYSFHRGFFWGVTSAYALGWGHHRHHLRVVHHSFYGHPYFGRDYGWRWWYRRPSLSYHNNYYFRDRHRPSYSRHRAGDYWIPRYTNRVRIERRQAARSRGHLNSDSVRSTFTRSYGRDSSARRTGQLNAQRYAHGRSSEARHRGANAVPESRTRPQTPRLQTNSRPDGSQATTSRYRSQPPAVVSRPPVAQTPSVNRSRQSISRPPSERRSSRQPDRNASAQTYRRAEPHRSRNVAPKQRSQTPARTVRQTPPARSRDAAPRESRSTYSGNRSGDTRRRHNDR